MKPNKITFTDCNGKQFCVLSNESNSYILNTMKEIG